MPDRVESAFRDLLASLQISKLYKIEHPMVQRALDKAYASITEALLERESLVFGIIGEELTCENEIFFELSALAAQAIHLFKTKGVERIAFSRGLAKEEFTHFLRYLAAGKDQVLPGIEQYLKEQGVRNIEAGKLKIGGGGGEGDKEGKGGGGEGVGPEGKGGRGEGAGGKDGGGGGGYGISGNSPAPEVYEHSMNAFSSSLAGIMNTEAVDHLALRHGVSHILEGLTTRHREFLRLVSLKRYHPTTFVHLLNVSVLAMFCAARLGFTKEDSIEIGIAGLFHDIGKMQISRQLLSKEGKLTDEEFLKIRSHTLYGAEILLDYIDTLGILPLVVAYEHHLKYDLSGYPHSPFNQKLHTASCIIAICDVYDALNQRRSYKADYAPDTVYAIMQKDRGKAFAPELLDKFFSYLGVWPIGCIVGLSDGSMAVVRDVHEEAIDLPVVEVVKPERREQLIDLKECRDSLKIERFVNPWKEGKELLSFV